MKSIFRSVAIITIFSVITRLCGFLFRIYLSRQIGTTELGLYQVAFSIFGVLLTIVSTGLPLTVSKMSASYKAKNDKASEQKMMSSALLIALATSASLCIIVFAFNKLLTSIFTDEKCVLILITLLPAVIFSAVYSVFRGNMWGHQKFFLVSLTELIEQVLRISFCALFIGVILPNLDGAISAGLSLSLACAISMIIVIVMYFVLGKKLSRPDKTYKQVLKVSSPITGVRVATSLLQPLISLVLPLRLISAGYTSAQALSSLGIATGMTMPFLFIPSTLVGSLSMALIPDLSTATAQNDNSHISSRVSSSIAFSIFISAFLIPIYIGAGQEIGLFFYNNLESGRLLALSAWVMLPLGITNITSAILNGLGLEVKSFINNIIGAVFMIVLLVVLPQFVGVRALIYSLGVCMSVVSLLNLRMIKKKVKVKLKIIKPLVIMVLLMLPTAAITSFITSILSNWFTLFFTLAFSCTIGALLFFFLCVAFKIIDAQTIFVKVKKLKIKFPKKIAKKRSK